MSIYQTIIKNIANGKKMFAVLLDPDVYKGVLLDRMIELLAENTPDFVFVGGSHTANSVEMLVNQLKSNLDMPVVLFPGNASQFTPCADALLNLSLLSGRNAEYLIGQQVASAMAIKNSGIEVIPTAYLLIDGGRVSSTEYVSNTRPIPADRPNIAVSTAVAGELLGMKMIYLEAGSGALNPVNKELIKEVKTQISLPLLVGGGIRTKEDFQKAANAGADLVVVGNLFENNPEKIKLFMSC